jgi:methylase of polypeptide subunit release factors
VDGSQSAAPSADFADLGSGKGAALIVAGGFPIKRAIGVELDDALTRVARENAERARPR